MRIRNSSDSEEWKSGSARLDISEECLIAVLRELNPNITKEQIVRIISAEITLQSRRHKPRPDLSFKNLLKLKHKSRRE
jgi:hypothetical protein